MLACMKARTCLERAQLKVSLEHVGTRTPVESTTGSVETVQKKLRAKPNVSQDGVGPHSG